MSTTLRPSDLEQVTAEIQFNNNLPLSPSGQGGEM